MPELPEVETFRSQVELEVYNKQVCKIKTSELMPVLGSINLIKSAAGKKLTKAFRYGKYLFIQFEDETTNLVLHFGMSGSLKFNFIGQDQNNQTPSKDRIPQTRSIQKHTHLTLLFADNSTLNYINPRRFGLIMACTNSEIDGIISKLGPDALSGDLNVKYLQGIFKNRTAPIKTVLLDQKVIAGLGNIYVTEILYSSHISPFNPAHLLTDIQIKLMLKNIRKILNSAIKNRGSTLTDKGYSDVHFKHGDFQNFHNCYGRQGLPCKICKTDITKALIANRSTYYCPRCQKY